MKHLPRVLIVEDEPAIAEFVIYIVKGTDVRHSGSQGVGSITR